MLTLFIVVTLKDFFSLINKYQLKHYLKVISKILSSSYRYNKIALLADYLRLIVKAVIHHKLQSSYLQFCKKTEQILGFNIEFFAYPQLINLFEEIFVYQVYEFTSDETAPIIFDCGSNIGMSILYFKSLYANSCIMGFEPDKETFELLEENIRNNNLSNVTIYNFALSDAEEEKILYKKSLKPGSLNMSLFNSGDDLQEEMVYARKLSDFISTPIDLIKIDVEGAEIEIIQDLIQNQKITLVKRMCIEYHPSLTSSSIDQFVYLINANNFLCRVKNSSLYSRATEKIIYCKNINLS